MPIENRINLVPLEDITIPEDRLRFAVDSEHVRSLADAFLTEDLMNPIVIDRDTKKLVAGRHRYGAFDLNKTLQAQPAHGTPDKWNKIPVRYCYNVTEQELLALELSENIRAKKMDWKEIALAVSRVHALSQGEEETSMKATAGVLGMSQQAIGYNLKAAYYIGKENNLVLQATSLTGAMNVIRRLEEREFDELKENVLSGAFQAAEAEGQTPLEAPDDCPFEAESSGDSPATPALPKPQAAPPAFSVCQGDFLEFAATYSGPRFNLLHCDFPYGINYDKSGFDYAKQHSIYGDSKDLYFALLSALVENVDRLIADSAHLIFWYNTRYQAETIDLLSRAGFKVWPHHLIWHKSDNAGVLADFQRGPRHTHETAIFATRGDRKLVKPVADSYSGPTTRGSGHVSEKPVDMLAHFFSMAVDSTTRVLDPTAGSCNSLVAAKRLGAVMGVGVELDGGYASRGHRIVTQEED